MAAKVEPAHIFGFFEYNGIMYPNIVLRSSIEASPMFDVRPDDMWIATYPKTGTHWMQEIVGLIQARGDPEKIDRSLSGGLFESINAMAQTFPSTREEELKNPLDMSPFMDVLNRAPSPRVITTHLPLELLPPTLTKTAKVIYVARNPKDTINSLYNFLAKSPGSMPWETILSMFVAGKIPYGHWSEHIKSFWKIKDEANVLFCFYEQMKKEPKHNARRIADFLNASLTDEEIDKVVQHSSFSGMKKTYEKAEKGGEKVAKAGGHLSFMNKGVSGGWKSRFTVAQNEMLNAWYRQQMADSDISFDFE